MRYYQNQVLPLTIATLLDAPFKATEIAPQPRSTMKAKSADTFTAMQESTGHKEAAVISARSEAAVNAIPATITTLDRRPLNRPLLRKEADFSSKEPEAVVARDLRRFGSIRVNIYGLENVRIAVDGMRLPDFYNGNKVPQ